MINKNLESRIISHATSSEPLASITKKIVQRIIERGNLAYVSVDQQIELLEQLKKFKLGEFLIRNRGLNGYWTNYILTYSSNKKNANPEDVELSPLEHFILEKAPITLATQERFKIFLKENQKLVKNGAALACIPCGLMGELLFLNYSEIQDIQLIGVDCDEDSLENAFKLANQINLSSYIQLHHKDAWLLNFKNEFDLITSNGLTIYESSDEKVIELYSQFYSSLRSNGKLVTSFLTPPPSTTITTDCEWNMSKINMKDLLLQKIIFSDLLDAKWQCYRTSSQIKTQLECAGFSDIQFTYDAARMFPTVTAHKR